MKRTSAWLVRPFEDSGIAPIRLGVGVALGYPLFVGLVHLFAIATIGEVELPFGPARYVGSVLVNGTLLGLLLGGHAAIYQGTVADLEQLRPVLSGSDDDFGRLKRDMLILSRSTRWLVTTGGMIAGLAVATLDPALDELYSHIGRMDPRYLVYIVGNMLFGALVARLVATEIHLTRSYARLGERVEVDLLDLSKVLVFARKGLRSVVLWVLISSVFSLFWVLDSAAQINSFLPIAILILATMALIAPTLGIHRSIRDAKVNELDHVAEAIRTERISTLAPRRAGAQPEDARLGNLIQYQAFIKSLREWPFDLSIVWRSFLLIVLGAGSWLGGAIVERLLNSLLD